MRRTVAVVLSAIALVATTLPSASADTTTVARSIAVDPPTFGAGGQLLDAVSCGAGIDPVGADPLVDILADSQYLDPSLGGSARIWATKPNSSGISYGPLVWVTNSSELAVFRVDVFNATSGQAVVWYQKSDGSGYVGRSAFTGTALQWAQRSGASLTYTWTPFNASHAVTGSTSSATISSFAVAHGQPSAGWAASIEAGCDSKAVGFQNFVYGDTPGDLKVIDYEDLTDNVVSKTSASFVAAGKPVTIGGSAQYGGPSTAKLLYRNASSPAYATTSSATSAASLLDLTCAPDHSSCRNQFTGVVLHPQYNTVYRWCYDADVAVQAACSDFRTIHVQAVVTATYPTTVSAGHAFSVTGKVTPVRTGRQVTLWGKKGTTTVKLGTSTVSSTGAFTVHGTVGSGSWTFWVTTPNDPYNAAGKSNSRSYSVH